MARVLFIFGLGGIQLVRALFIVGVVALHLRLTWLVYMLLRPCWILDLLSTLSLVCSSWLAGRLFIFGLVGSHLAGILFTWLAFSFGIVQLC